MKPIIEALRKAAYGHGLKSVAADAGCSEQYLGRVLKPDPEPDEVKHIQLRTAMQVMLSTGNFDALVLMAAELGLTVAPEPVPDKATSREECADDVRCLAEMQAAMAEGKPPHLVQTLACRACDDIQQTAVRYAEEWQTGGKA